MYQIPTVLLSVGCLNSISVYKLALARLDGSDVKTEVVKMLSKLENDDPMRKGRYHQWRAAISAQ